jgi:hypothetical protein
MKRERKTDDLIELGAASVQTKGPSFGRDDTHGGLIPVAGLSGD